MTVQETAQLIAQVGFPIVFIVVLVYYVGKFGLPKAVALIEGLVKDFREEMERERQFHADNVNRLFETSGKHRDEVISAVEKAGDATVAEIKECRRKGD